MAEHQRAHKIKLKLNKTQASYCASSAGVARFAYNWALAQWNKQFKEFKSGLSTTQPSEGELRKLFNQQKKIELPPHFLVLHPNIQRQYFPWVNKVSKYCSQQAIQDLGIAFKKFFNKQVKYPKFKKKGNKDSFYIGNNAFKIIEKTTTNKQGKIVTKSYLKLPLLEQPIPLKENLRFKGKINNVVVSRTAGHWFASFSINAQLAPELNKSNIEAIKNNLKCGVDLGITHLATIYESNGNSYKIDNPKGYKRHLNRLKRLQIQSSRKKKASNNRKKVNLRLSKLHEKIANIRKDSLHKLTSKLAANYVEVNIEDLNIKGMLKNHKLAGSIADCGFGIFKQQLEYKTELSGSKLNYVDRFYASSKTCSCCGEKNKELKLSQRKWQCSSCNTMHDRDINASKNLLNTKLKVLKTKKVTIKKKNRYEKIKVEVPEGIGELTPMENPNQGCVMGECSPITKDNQFNEVGKSNKIKLKSSEISHLNRLN